MTNVTRIYPTTRSIVTNVVLIFFIPVFVYAQPLFLTAIAVNRFTAFSFPLKHAFIWRVRTVVVVTIALAATAVVLGVGCPGVTALIQLVKCSRASKKEREELYCDEYWVFALVYFLERET